MVRNRSSIRRMLPQLTARQHTFKYLIPLCGLLILSACAKSESPTLPPPPTAIADSGLAAAPTPTLAVPTVEATLPSPPTLAPVPTSSPPPATATPEATATAAAIVLMEAADFGTDRNPLTGELMEDPELLQRRPIAVKLSNSPPSYTRPQSGMNDADWVFEHTTEGNVTRFTAILYGKTPPKVGPIRSARLIDVELPAMFDAALAFSGASVGVSQRLNRSDFTQRILRSASAGYYRTGEDKPFEHTLYGIPTDFWAALDSMDQNSPPVFNGILAFSSEPPAGGSPAATATVDYNWTLVEWKYDQETGRYQRWADGEIHRDANSDEQVSASNVIVISPNHVKDPTICEEVRDGVCAHLSVQVQLWGSGGGTVFRDGQRYEVTWHRADRADLLTFTDSNGDPFPLQIGNSFVQVMPSWLANPLSSTP